MKIRAQLQLFVFASAVTISFAAHSYPGESISLDPVSGNYNITYWNDSMEPPALETTVFVPATKIDPAVRSRFLLESDGKIVYRYTVSSSKQSKQTLISIILDPVNSVIGTRDDRGMAIATVAESAAAKAVFKANMAALTTPAGWDGTVAFGSGGSSDDLIRIGWGASVERSTGLKPGGAVNGFGFSSNALPGIIEAELSGDSPVHGWSGEGPAEDSAIIQQIKQIQANDFVSRPAAVPTIAVPDPFDAAALLERIQTQMHTWIGMQLLDAAFSSQLDRYFQSAISAYRLNQPKVGKKEIQTMRELLKREHADADREEGGDDRGEKGDHDEKNKPVLIDKLAARILDFDLKYVTKRMGGDKDD